MDPAIYFAIRLLAATQVAAQGGGYSTCDTIATTYGYEQHCYSQPAVMAPAQIYPVPYRGFTPSVTTHPVQRIEPIRRSWAPYR